MFLMEVWKNLMKCLYKMIANGRILIGSSVLKIFNYNLGITGRNEKFRICSNFNFKVKMK